jgi:hypothetical protein
MKANVDAEDPATEVPQLNELGKPTYQKTKAPAKVGPAAWLIPPALLLLGAIPLVVGCAATPSAWVRARRC